MTGPIFHRLRQTARVPGERARNLNASLFLTALLALALLSGCTPASPAAPGALLARQGDEIIACGQFFHTGVPVVLWMDPGGYDAYRVERRFVPWDQAGYAASRQEVPTLTPNRYGPRKDLLTPEEFERVRGGGWDLPLLQRVVDQLVLHYDVSGVSRQCFETLHDRRGLSIHFMIDLDGTIYQTLDLKERAWHATTSNSRSIGIEIASVGSYADHEKDPFARWYARDASGRTRITVPPELGDGGIRTPSFVGHPIRDELVYGEIQGTRLRMYDLTAQQYNALIHLTAAICTVFPKIRCDYPRDEHGNLIPCKLPDEVLKDYHGILGHYHIQLNKTDPGPALQWDRIVLGARKLGHLKVRDQCLPLPAQPWLHSLSAPSTAPSGELMHSTTATTRAAPSRSSSDSRPSTRSSTTAPSASGR